VWATQAPAATNLDTGAVHAVVQIAVSLNVEHELTRQRKWDKQETQEYMRHFNALKLDSLTSVPPLALIAATGNAREKKNLQMFG